MVIAAWSIRSRFMFFASRHHKTDVVASVRLNRVRLCKPAL